MKFFRDTWLVFQRQMQLMLRNPVWLIVGIIQPLFYLLLFAPLLKPALGVSSNADAYKLFVPGLLVLLAMFGSLFTGFGLIAELRAGVIERSRVTPVSRFALLVGRSLRDVVSLLFQALLIVVIAVAFGLRVNALDVTAAFGLMAVISLMLSAFSYAISLKLRSEDALAPLLNTISQPLLLTAGILLPLTFAPKWLKTVADWNPFSWAVDGVRALFDGHPGADSVWQAAVVIGGLTVLTVVWASRAFAKGVR
ncbi:ABC transporter permease [Dactylosporangium darangshiense]|jgi:ABC-2 type transport system permease protein|uniref:Transport permease protein n=1 Tax=Dactylosporangium darangshiense TaxID=579108 RepID=A0ABP8D4V9_9ACTN|nr:ABC transporter permease [Dactylosporangium sp.]